METPISPAPDNAGILAHLNMLQGVIARLAGNSAQCKTWCLSLVSALIAFAGGAHSQGVFVVTILPIGMFLLLDAAYLGNEIAYRTLYNAICDEISLQKYPQGRAFRMGASLSWLTFGLALKSWSICIFYYPLAALYFAAVSDSEVMRALVTGK